MKCPLCNIEMRIKKSRNVIENDDTSERPTKLFIEFDMTCGNRNCSNYDTVVDTVRNEQPIG